MRRILLLITFSLLLMAGWTHVSAQEAATPAQRLKLILVDNKSTFIIDDEQNHYVNTLRLDQPEGSFQLTADMLNEGDNIITITRQDDNGGNNECIRINLAAVFNASSVTITPTVSHYVNIAWSDEDPLGHTITCQRGEVINLSTIEVEDDFFEPIAENTHPSRYEYSASMDANIVLPDPNIPVILTPDNDIIMGSETSADVLVSGYYLTEQATLTVTGPFAVSPATLTADEVNNGTMVTISFTGSNHSGTGTLTITSGTATLTVNISHRSADPVIITTPTTVNISGSATSGTFTVQGTDLEGPITVTGNANFTVSPTSIAMEDAMAGNVTVTITPKSSITTLTSGTITLTSPGAAPVTVQVTYDPPFYASIDFNKCTSSDATTAEIIGYNGWSLTNLTIYNPGQYCGYLSRGRSITYTMPTSFTGSMVYVTVTNDGTGSSSSGSLLVNNSSHSFSGGSSYTWAVNVSAGGTITFSAPSNNYSCDIAKIVISAVNPAALNRPRIINRTHDDTKIVNDPQGLTLKQERR